MLIKIDDLDLSLQTRAGTDAETIAAYAAEMADGTEFPPVDVFRDGDRLILADGFHRVMAARENGRTCFQANVHEGDENQAIIFGGTANNKQGKRPTRADTQHFLDMVWARREAIFGGTPTGGNFAKTCGVSQQTGNRFVQSRLNEMPVAPKRPTMPKAKLPTAPKMPVRPTHLIGANGKQYPVRPTRPTAQVTTVTKTETTTHVVPLDRYGTEIPVERQAAFDGEGRLREAIQHVSEARVAVRKAVEAGDIAFAAVRQEALIQLDNAYSFLKGALPHCVCRMCQGTGCMACHDRGWQTEEEYARNPREFKA